MTVPNASDICISLRGVDTSGETERTLDAALALLEAAKPDRVEWSYCRRNEEVLPVLREKVEVFVPAINTISPPGRAVDFDGEPCIAPWMRSFGSPGKRLPYICMNDADDMQSRREQIRDIAVLGLGPAVQLDDWACNAQMINWKHPCFCESCVAGFAASLGIDIDYRAYLYARGVRSNDELLARIPEGGVPLWEDYRRFQEETVRAGLRTLRAAVARETGRPPVLAVNAIASHGQTRLLSGLVEYLDGETNDFSPAGLWKLSCAAREIGVRQVSSFFPDVPASQYGDAGFILRVRRSIAVAYAVGVIPLFPYDVYAGDEPRWFGKWDDYAREYDFVRERRDRFDKFVPESMEELDDGTIVVETVGADADERLRHAVGPDASWEITDA